MNNTNQPPANPPAPADEKPQVSQKPAPLSARERIQTLDILRGLALFGILVINAQQMFQPFVFAGHSYANAPIGIVPGEAGVLAHWVILSVFFDTKFLTLFSLLFGIGFSLQAARAEARGAPFAWTYLRRLGVLAVFGVIHATLFYPADVLFIYAVIGALFFLIARNWGPALLMQIGLIVFFTTISWALAMESPNLDLPILLASSGAMISVAVFGSVVKLSTFKRCIVMTGILALSLTAQIQGLPDTGARTQIADLQTQADAVSQAFADGEYVFGDTAFQLPLDRVEIDTIRAEFQLDDIQRSILEQSVMRSGPLRAFFTRGITTLALLQLVGMSYLYWRTFALFAIGASLMKWGLLNKGNRFGPRAMKAGLGIGIPLALVATWMRYQAYGSGAALYHAALPLHLLSALAIALGLVGLVMVWVDAGKASFIKANLAALGRAASTNYIGQSAILAVITTGYGLSLAGALPRWQQSAICVAVFIGLAMFSRIWLTAFEYGPLEWVWRSLTYGRPAKLLRDRTD